MPASYTTSWDLTAGKSRTPSEIKFQLYSLGSTTSLDGRHPGASAARLER
jgi:hypothetical protein